MEVDSNASRDALYRAAVGAKKADFYVPKFVGFDAPGASQVSWNWPAFFVSFYWFLYRRMYGYWVIYCLLIPFVLLIAGGIAGAILGNKTGNLLYLVTIVAYRYGWVPMYANALYHRTIKKRIETLRLKIPDPATQLAVLDNSPHTSPVLLVAAPFVVLALAGILAAIAIPVYQNYTTRARSPKV
jgi:hypothetical protein